jgi:hypothetical protein
MIWCDVGISFVYLWMAAFFERPPGWRLLLPGLCGNNLEQSMVCYDVDLLNVEYVSMENIYIYIYCVYLRVMKSYYVVN